MIAKALGFITEQLNDYLRREVNTNKSIVKMSGLMSSEGNSSMHEESELFISMVNLTEESSLANRPSFQRQSSVGVQKVTPIHVNVQILIATSLKENQYKEGLRWLSLAIKFFHQHPLFSDQHRNMPTGIDKISFEIENMNFEHMSQLWTALRTPYRPSILYKMRISQIISNPTDSFPTQIA